MVWIKLGFHCHQLTPNLYLVELVGQHSQDRFRPLNFALWMEKSSNHQPEKFTLQTRLMQSYKNRLFLLIK